MLSSHSAPQALSSPEAGAPLRILGLDESLEKFHSVSHECREELQKFFATRIHSAVLRPPLRTIFQSEENGEPALAFANFVFQGGGILGISHLGFLYALERIGVRCLGAAGTSAGAILAMLISAARGRILAGAVGEQLLPVLWHMPAASFIDGPYAVRRLVKYALRRKTVVGSEMLLPLIGAISRVVRTAGLNPGYAFEQWLSATLSNQFDVRTVGSLLALLQDICGQQNQVESSGDLLQIVATAIPQTDSASIPVAVKLTFPQDFKLLATKYLDSPAAILARASMSVPLFFEPLRLELHQEQWREFVRNHLSGLLAVELVEELEDARRIAFIDGGMISNFPIDAFLGKAGSGASRSDYPVPTIGVTLVARSSRPIYSGSRGVRELFQLTKAVFDGMRHARDRDALAIARLARVNAQAPEVIVAPVDIGNHNWLNFQFDEGALSDLFVRGIAGATRFVSTLRSVRTLK